MGRSLTNQSKPSAVADAVRAARLRMGLSELLIRLGPALAIGASASIGLVLMVKVFGARIGVVPTGAVSWAAVIAAPVLIAAAWAGMYTRRHWPSELAAASKLDAVSGLADVLGSALVYSHHRRPAGFEAITLDRARADLAKVDVHAVAPLKLNTPWWWGLLGLLLAGLSAAYAPLAPPPVLRPTQAVRTQTPAQVSQAAEEIASVQEDLQEAIKTGAASAADLQALEELEAELLDGRRDPEDAKSAAAATLERAAEAARQQAEHAKEESAALHEQLAEVDPESFDRIRPLAEALSSGDLQAAAEAAQSLRRESAESMQTETSQIAEELRSLAEEIEPESAIEPEEPESASPSKDQIREDLKRRGVPEEEAERLAEQAEQRQQQQDAERQAERRAKQQAKELADELRREADELESQQRSEEPNRQPNEPDAETPSESESAEQEPTDQTDTEQPTPSPPGVTAPSPANQQSPSESEAKSDQQDEEAKPDPEASEPARNPDASESPKPSGEPGSESEQSDDSERAAEDGAEGQPAEPNPGGQPKPGAGSPSEGQPSPGSPSEPGQDPGSPNTDGSGQQPSPGQPAQPTDQPSSGDDVNAGEGPGDDGRGSAGGSGPGQGDGRGTGLSDTLNDLAQRQTSAERAQRLAEQLEQQSDRLAGGQPPPDTRAELPPEPAVDSPWDGRTEVVDARRQPADETIQEQVISEWYNPNARSGESVGRVGNPADAGDVVNRAQRQAQRALEQQAVPKRRAELVKRIFQRLADRADTLEREPVQPTTDAKDAP